MARRRSYKKAWWTYFFGPVQLLRLKILELPREMQMVECPLCDCVLKTDPSAPGNPQYSVAGNLASHLCGDRHRKKLFPFYNPLNRACPPSLLSQSYGALLCIPSLENCSVFRSIHGALQLQMLFKSQMWTFIRYKFMLKQRPYVLLYRMRDASLWPDKQNRNGL